MKQSRNEWSYAKKKCRLDDTEVEMAIRLRFTPEKVLGMIPDRRESWKDAPPLRLRRLYDKKYGNRL